MRCVRYKWYSVICLFLLNMMYLLISRSLNVLMPPFTRYFRLLQAVHPLNVHLSVIMPHVGNCATIFQSLNFFPHWSYVGVSSILLRLRVRALSPALNLTFRTNQFSEHFLCFRTQLLLSHLNPYPNHQFQPTSTPHFVHQHTPSQTYP